MSSNVDDLAFEAKAIIAKYPEGRARSALLPLLHLVQERDGYVTETGMAEIASILSISEAEVRSVATFYTMFYLAPKGRTVISVCHNIACTLMGAERVISSLESRLDIRCGQTTPDGAITLERVECLAACDMAPMLQLNFGPMIGPVDPSNLDAFLPGAGVPSSSRPEPRPATPAESSQPDVSQTQAEPPPLVDSIPLTPEELALTQQLEARRGEHRSRLSPAEKLAELPPLEDGVGTGPETPEKDEGSEDGPSLRPRGAE